MVKSFVLASLAAAALLPAAAMADDDAARCTAEPQARWLSVEAITAKAVEAGYKDIRDVKVQGTCYEVYGFTAAGERAEIMMDPMTGAVAATDDDD